MGKEVIHEPFAVINADDFYGRESFQVLADYLKTLENSHDKYCMVGYRVGNTLSESGTVARGVCETDKNGNLTGVVERTQVMRIDGKVSYKNERDQWIAIDDNTPVSMNMWGVSHQITSNIPMIISCSFLMRTRRISELSFFIPLLVNHLIVNGNITVKVLDTPSKWFGVTYADDRPEVVSKLKSLTANKAYPSPLW